MDRLTRREPDGQAIALHGDCGWYGKIVQRLAAYEDTGLTPQEIKSMQEWHDFRDSRDCISADRLRALAEADRDGRCVVLPCKIGSTVYMATQVFDGSKTKWVIGSRKIDTIGGNALNSVWAVSTQPYELHFVPSEFGRSVFLSRPEAEAALKGATHKPGGEDDGKTD